MSATTLITGQPRPALVAERRGRVLFVSAATTDLNLALQEAFSAGLSIVLEPGNYTTAEDIIDISNRTLAISARSPGTATITASFRADGWTDLAVANVTLAHNAAAATATPIIAVDTSGAARSSRIALHNTSMQTARAQSAIQTAGQIEAVALQLSGACVLGSRNAGLNISLAAIIAAAAPGTIRINGDLAFVTGNQVVGLLVSGKSEVDASGAHITCVNSSLAFSGDAADANAAFGDITFIVNDDSFNLTQAILLNEVANRAISIESVQIMQKTAAFNSGSAIFSTEAGLGASNATLRVGKLAVLGREANLVAGTNITAPAQGVLAADMSGGFLN